MKRRSLLLGCAAAPILLAAGCATVTPNQISTMVANIDAGLAPALPFLAKAVGIPPATLAKVTTDLSTVHTIALSLAGLTSTQIAPAAVVQALADAVNDAVAICTAPPVSLLMPPAIELGFQAAGALLPVIEGLAGLSSATLAPPTMTQDQALAYLHLSALAAP